MREGVWDGAVGSACLYPMARFGAACPPRSLPGAEPWSWSTRFLFLFSFVFLSVPHELSREEFSLVSKELVLGCARAVQG